MTRRVDALFGGEGPPRRARVVELGLLLGVALALDLSGILCCTSVPGAALTLVAWLWADGDLARVRSGHLAPRDGPTLERMKQVANAGLVLCGVTFVIQIALLQDGTYERWVRGWLAAFG